MFNIIKGYWDQLTKIVHKFNLSKLKVFYQILIMTIIMIVFLGIQSATGLSVINTLQNAVKTNFSDSAANLNEISNLKTETANIQIIYLQALAGKDPVGIGASRNFLNLRNIIDRVKALENVNEGSKKALNAKLNALSSIIDETPSVTNYDPLMENINEINSVFDKVYTDVRFNSIKSIENNDTFAAQSAYITIIIMVVSIVLSLLMAIVITNSISGPLKVMEGAAKSLAVGDLSQKIDAVGCPEVIGVVTGLNQAILGLRDLVQGINGQSATLYTASKELKNASSETGKSASEVARTMGELARASAEQAEQVNQAVNTVIQLSDMVKKVSEEMENIALSSEKVAQSAKAGQKSTRDVSNQINELFESTQEVAGVIHMLSETSGEISEITGVIQGIAEQTTLLALNASIEAARAGDQGRGFDVVAQETGKLAEQSKQAAGLISSLINQMKIRTNQAVEVMEKSMSRVGEGKNLAAEASETFEAIFESLMANLSQIDTIAASTKKMAQSNQEVTEAINAIAAISEESLASTEEISATTQEQSASVEEVSALAENLTQIADNLRKYVTAFELEM